MAERYGNNLRGDYSRARFSHDPATGETITHPDGWWGYVDPIQQSRLYLRADHSYLLSNCPDEIWRFEWMRSAIRAHIDLFADELVRKSEAQQRAVELGRMYDELGVLLHQDRVYFDTTPKFSEGAV